MINGMAVDGQLTLLRKRMRDDLVIELPTTIAHREQQRSVFLGIEQGSHTQ